MESNLNRLTPYDKTATIMSASGFDTMSMLRLCSLDPPKYGWTACGGVASMLEPHEMARRPEGRERFLKRQREHKAAAAANAAEAAASPKYYTITDPSAENETPSAAATSVSYDGAAATPAAAGGAATAEGGGGGGGGGNNDNDNDRGESKNDDDRKSSVNQISIRIHARDDDGRPDIYTYHRGRAGQEPRDPVTGELLCDTDPADTNHGWVPPETVVKVTVDFPLGDPNEEEYVDSDLSDDDDDDDGNGDNFGGGGGGRKGSSSGGRFDRGDGGGNVRASRSRLTRAGSVGSGALVATPNAKEAKQKRQPPPKVLPRYVQVVQWDLGDPTTPSPEEYAANVAAEFGLTFPQTMDLKDSIEDQIGDFLDRQHRKLFRAPIALRDPYGGERPAAQRGPPERHHGPVLGVPDAGAPRARTEGGGARTSVSGARRSNSAIGGSSSGRRWGANSAGGGGGGAPSSARSARSARPVGAVKPDRRGIHVVPPDQVPRHDVSGDVYAEEVLKRARRRSCQIVREMIGKGEQVLETVWNEVCHICHNRKATGLTFHCGRHAYCDAHCASRLSFRAQDYDKKNPTNIPVDYCPVCSLHCTCAKCTRRLEDVSKCMRIECEKQNCGVEDVVMDDLYDLCSSKQKADRDNKSRSSSAIGSASGKKKGSSKKVKLEDAVDAIKGHSAFPSRHQSTSRSTRSSPSVTDDIDSSGDGARPCKKRKTSDAAVPVPVLKVPPSDFPHEMHGAKDLDPSIPEDLNKVFTPDGSFPVEESPVTSAPATKQKYQEKIEMSADGNFFQCAVCGCEDGDGFICCKKCPRAYHKKCFEEQDAPQGEGDPGARQRRVCKWCERDGKILPTEDIKSGQMKVEKRLQKAYGKYKDVVQGYVYTLIMIGELLQILDRLKKYDYGEIFSVPVDTSSLPDYLSTVSRPMDYSTIINSLEKGLYSSPSSESHSSSNDEKNSMDPLEEIVLTALKDIEQVHHNCFLYNARGSAYYRAGEVQASKWKAYFVKEIKERLPDWVQASLAVFQESCRAERDTQGGPMRRFQVAGIAIRSKALAVFDPDTKRIVKQYSSKSAARTAALMLYEAGYTCEHALSTTNVKPRIEAAEDPAKPLFGYQWVPTEKLKRGNFEVKPYFRDDDLVSPTPNNIAILKEDTVAGLQVRGFGSEESAYEDWAAEKMGSFQARVDPDAGDNAECQPSEFVADYLDGNKSIGGIVWKRVNQTDSGTSVAAMKPKSPGKVVMEEEHAAATQARKVKSEEQSSE